MIEYQILCNDIPLSATGSVRVFFNAQGKPMLLDRLPVQVGPKEITISQEIAKNAAVAYFLKNSHDQLEDVPVTVPDPPTTEY